MYINVKVTQQGLGRDVYVVSQDQLDKFLKGIFISEIGWTLAICITKCSILAFYWRLFSNRGRSFRIALWAFGAWTINWGVTVVCVSRLINPMSSHIAHESFMNIQGAATIFQCFLRPKNFSDGQCFHKTYWFFIGSSIPHIITDIALICLPMPVIWNLQMSRSRKVSLSFIFGLGVL